jgi:glycosyltransferase involved in cell wall biosynthesis
MKVAIVHDQLGEFGGAERVLVALKKIFPQADVYTSTHDPETLGPHADLIKNWNIKTSWFGKIPLINKLYSPLRFLTPLIWESFDFSGYDLVISSSGSWMCKGIKTYKPTVHISYLHHPPRYLYGYETAIEWQKYLLVKIYGNIINHFLRIWDFNSSQRADYFIANSQETRKRIQKFYRRDATVIYPPVNLPKKITNYQLLITNYYITVSRLARAKHVDVLIKAANKYKFNLKIVGVGRDEKYLRKIAGPTVDFLGNLTDQQLIKLYQNAKAFLFSAVDEEFGIAPVEAMGYGLPVLAYNSGGVVEYIKDKVNGFLFKELNEDSLIKKINELTSLSKEKYFKMRKAARKTAENFSEERFRQKVLNFISRVTRYKLHVTR